jgi:hypothetical protein
MLPRMPVPGTRRAVVGSLIVANSCTYLEDILWECLSKTNRVIKMSFYQPSARDRALEYYQSLAPESAKPGEGTEAYKDIDELAYALSRVPTFTSRPIKIVAIGAGFSGLSLARAVHSGKLPNAKITIYEKNADVGGTWYENRYPG